VNEVRLVAKIAQNGFGVRDSKSVLPITEAVEDVKPVVELPLCATELNAGVTYIP
jgi:hypothetical protein